MIRKEHRWAKRRHRVDRWVRAAAILASCALMPAAAPAADSRVTLQLEASAATAPRGGMLPVDAFALIEAGWHINAHEPTEPYLIPTELTLTLPPGITMEPIQYPRPDKHAFAFAQGKELLVYEGKLGLATAIHVPAEFAGSRVRIEASLRYQACNDTMCLPPTTVQTELVVAVGATVEPPASTDQPAAGNSGDVIHQWLDQRGLAFTLLAVALLGIGLNLTPCVYPLISVTVAYFGGHAEGRMSRKLTLAMVYVLGIALSFSALGVAAAVSGGLFGAAMQKPAVMLFIAGVMVMLALSSFGLYQIRPPVALMQWAGGATSGVAGAGFMGLTMGIVAAPCVGPLVLALLVAVGTRQDPMLGFLLFFALAIGMGAPYVLLALVAGSIRHLPRSGEWLVWIERLFGFVLLGMAAYYVGPLLPPLLRAWLITILIAVAGLYLGFIDPSGRSLRLFPTVKRVVGLTVLALALWTGWPQSASSTITWRDLTPPMLKTFKPGGQPMVIDFGAEWCIPCVEMAKSTFVDPKVVSAAADFDMVRVDVTEDSPANTMMLGRFDVRGVPTILVFNAAGKEVVRLVGFTSADELIEAMKKASG